MVDWHNKIRSMTASELNALWNNARKRADKDARAKELLELIEASGLDYRDRTTVKLGDRIGRTIERIVFSAEGRTAAMAATEAGLPALAGSDPLLVRELGADYGSHNEATIQAGYLVNNMMVREGYIGCGDDKLPSTCAGKTGRLYRRRTLGDPKP